MVLSTMNDEEKAYEAFRICKWAKEIHDEYKHEIGSKFARGTRFPYFQRVVFDDDRQNKWYLTFLCKSKSDKKKGLYYCFCYTIYEIEKKKSDGTNKFDGNTGKGVLMFDPLAMSARVDGIEKRGMAVVNDIVPHAFNRYTERYLKPIGKENIEFQRKVENIMLRWKHFDVIGDSSSEKHKDKGFAPYDVFMSGGGILRGCFVSEGLIRFFSYVSDDMLYEDQSKWQDEMEKEYQRWKRIGMYSAT